MDSLGCSKFSFSLYLLLSLIPNNNIIVISSLGFYQLLVRCIMAFALSANFLNICKRLILIF